jgi:hypothetical protein
MSDYLWDKTGEPDEDVERLEELLGRFRHRGRAPELPTEAAGRDAERTVALRQTHAPRPTRAPMLLRPAWLAVAAALLVAFAAGALLLLSRNASHVGGRQEQAKAAAQKPQAVTRATSVEQSSPREDSTQQTTSSRVAAPGNDETTAGANEVAEHDEQSGTDGHGGRSPRVEERRQDGEVAAKQRGGEGIAGARRGAGEEVEGRAMQRTVASSASPEEGRAQREQTPEEGGGQALEERRRAAKDDLMYVLRLTGLKLKEVQKRTQKVDGWKSAFDRQQ